MLPSMKTRIAVLAMLLLAACAGPSVTPSERSGRALTWSSMTYAAKDGPILVDTIGSPGGQATGALGPMVAQAMTGAVLGYPAQFTADPTRVPHPNFRTVMVFNPAPSLTEGQACGGNPAVLAGPPSGRMGIFAAFCNGGRPLNSVRGSAEVVGGAADPRFAALVRQATFQLFLPPTEDRGLDDLDLF